MIAPVRVSLWTVMTVSALALGLYVLGFFLVAAINPPFKLRFEAYPALARLHILPAGLALSVGAFQFSARIRTRYPTLHRYAGRIYIAAVLAGAVGGLLIAFRAHGGAVTGFGFATLAVLWAWSVWQAFRYARARDFLNHQRRMIRNYALTFAVVTLRVEPAILERGVGLGFDHAYAIVAWLSWVGNLVLAEWWLVERLRRPERRPGA
jgi:uncharacterized membrane protein